MLVCNAGTGRPNAQSEKAFQNGIDIYPDAAMDGGLPLRCILRRCGIDGTTVLAFAVSAGKGE